MYGFSVRTPALLLRSPLHQMEEKHQRRFTFVQSFGGADIVAVAVANGAVVVDFADIVAVAVTHGAVIVNLADIVTVAVADGAVGLNFSLVVAIAITHSAVVVDFADVVAVAVANCAVGLDFADIMAVAVAEILCRNGVGIQRQSEYKTGYDEKFFHKAVICFGFYYL